MRKDLECAVRVRRVELLPDSSSQAPLNDDEEGFEMAGDDRTYNGVRKIKK